MDESMMDKVKRLWNAGSSMKGQDAQGAQVVPTAGAATLSVPTTALNMALRKKYTDYAVDAQTSGQSPMSFEQFVQRYSALSGGNN